MFNVSALLLDDALLKCVVTEVVLFSACFQLIDANSKHKTQKNFYTRALLLLSRPPCWNKHGATRTTSATRHVTTRTTRHECRVMSWGVVGASTARHARHAQHVARVVSWRDAASRILA